MEQSVLDRIKQGNHVASDFIWRNGKMGVITDMKYSGNYRFFECYIGENGMLHRRHPEHEPIENNPLVCIGITAYWLDNRKGPAGIRRIFDVYTKRAFEDFKYMFRNDVNTVYWKDADWKKYFYMFSIPQEKKKNKVSEALFEYITPYDQQLVRDVMKEYIHYLQDIRDTYRPPVNEFKSEKKEETDRVVEIDRIMSHFKMTFDKKTYTPTLKMFLEQPDSDKNLARVALLIYNSPSFIRTDYKTFSKWYKDFCHLVGCKFHSSYEPNKLQPIDEDLKNKYYFLF